MNRLRASHLIVIAVAALALTFGSATAGAVAGARWINGHHIKPHSIPANRLQNATVTNKQLKKGTIQGDRIANRTIDTDALTDDTVDDLQQTVVYVDNVVVPDSAEASGYVPATCPAGTQVVAGYVKPGGNGLVSFANSYIDPDQNALMVQFSIPGAVTVQTICLR